MTRHFNNSRPGRHEVQAHKPGIHHEAVMDAIHFSSTQLHGDAKHQVGSKPEDPFLAPKAPSEPSVPSKLLQGGHWKTLPPFQPAVSRQNSHPLASRADPFRVAYSAQRPAPGLAPPRPRPRSRRPRKRSAQRDDARGFGVGSEVKDVS